jgi:hypothetical protein
MFAIENILPTLYTNVYGWSPGSIGLSFLSPGIGEVSSSFYQNSHETFELNCLLGYWSVCWWTDIRLLLE